MTCDRLTALCSLVLLSFAFTSSLHAEVTVTEINPSQSTLHSTDPDGGSGGRVNHLAVTPSNNAIYYAASEWGGLYKSVDQGRNWSHLDGHLPTVTWDVKVSPADPNRVIATSFYDGRVSSIAGINVSMDGGSTWIHPGSATPPLNFCESAARRDEPSAFGISFDPDHPQDIYVMSASIARRARRHPPRPSGAPRDARPQRHGPAHSLEEQGRMTIWATLHSIQHLWRHARF
jgi:hypothetical protein